MYTYKKKHNLSKATIYLLGTAVLSCVVSLPLFAQTDIEAISQKNTASEGLRPTTRMPQQRSKGLQDIAEGDEEKKEEASPQKSLAPKASTGYSAKNLLNSVARGCNYILDYQFNSTTFGFGVLFSSICAYWTLKSQGNQADGTEGAGVDEAALNSPPKNKHYHLKVFMGSEKQLNETKLLEKIAPSGDFIGTISIASQGSQSSSIVDYSCKNTFEAKLTENVCILKDKANLQQGYPYFLALVPEQGITQEIASSSFRANRFLFTYPDKQEYYCTHPLALRSENDAAAAFCVPKDLLRGAS